MRAANSLRCRQWLVSLLLCYVGITSAAASPSPAVLPKPSGPFGVSASAMELIDHGRADPFAPSHEPRKLMISAFYPSVRASQCQTELQPYLPPTTAAFENQEFAAYGIPNNTFARLELSLCKPCSDKSAPDLSTTPLVLFSPGLGNSRLVYSFLAQAIASAGYIVVTIDHPYDADIVEYPDGSFVGATNITTEAQIELALDTRVKDASFVLTSLSECSTISHLFPSRPKSIDTSHAGIFGHSLGGAAAYSAILKDRRFVASANLDGAFYGNSALKQDKTKHPFLLFGHDGDNQTTVPSWKTVWSRLEGWKLELELGGSQHEAFEDLPVLAEALGLTSSPADSPLGQLLLATVGTINGTRASHIISDVMVKFFDFGLNGRSAGPLEEAVKSYHELQVVDKGNGA
ncbi:MAG: hypothetical protein M4579_001999 [Chaenotheca gracillima]|nr:MAG: hypothetical protein M4579_001999 [Chaenotheca gracillima]